MNIKYSKEILKSLENAITVVALFEGEDVSTTFDKINMISRNFNSKENSIDTVTLI
ncbi:aminopeptidase, partial [Clostridioides difficile]|nr:aminopeptidase [Clostridioides difficile]